MLVDRAVYDDFLALLRDRVAALRTGPLVSKGHRSSVLAHLAGAVEQGARIELGGEPEPGHGCGITPAVLTEVTAEMQKVTGA